MDVKLPSMCNRYISKASYSSNIANLAGIQKWKDAHVVDYHIHKCNMELDTTYTLQKRTKKINN